MGQPVQCPVCQARFDGPLRHCSECGASLATSGNEAPTSIEELELPIDAAQSPLSPGDLLAGRYRILEEIGRGGMGIVYRAEDLEVHETLAIKVLAPRIADRPEMIERFKEEMKLSRKIAHPGVCKIYDLGEADGRYFISMQYVDGDSLDSLLRRVGPLRVPRIRQWLHQLCEGLDAAHHRGVVHRDLKPGNIMIDRDGNAVIMDFGLAISSGGNDGRVPTGIEGTPGYMAPEQARGASGDDRTDIYALGCILYELLSGTAPFVADSLPELISLQREGRHRGLRRDLQIDADLERVTLKCLSVDPAGRFGSAAEILDVVDHGFAEAELSAGELRRWRPGRTTAWLGAAAMLAAPALVPLLRGTTLAEEIQLDFPREAALSKAREIVRELGYDIGDREIEVQLRSTGVSRLLVLETVGIDGLRAAVRDGDTVEWLVTMSDPAGSDKQLEQGEFHVRVGLDGRLHGFHTPEQEETDAPVVTEDEALRVAVDAVDRWLGVELAGLEREVVTRTFPPAVNEIYWRNPTAVRGHREVLRASLQGSRLTRVSRELSKPQGWRSSDRPVYFWADRFEDVAMGILSLAGFLIFVIGAVYLFRENRWSELRRTPPLVAALILSVPLVLAILLTGNNWTRPAMIIGVLVLVPIAFGLFLTCYAGLFCWLRNRSPLRMLDLRMIFRGKLLTAPAPSALVHGVLGGVVLAGLEGLSGAAASRLSGYLPGYGAGYGQLETIAPSVNLLLETVYSALFFSVLVAVAVELAERLSRRRWVLPVAALIFVAPGVMPSTLADADAASVLAQIVLNTLLAVLTVLLLFWLYRRLGLGTVIVASAANVLILESVGGLSLGHAPLTRLAAVALLLVAGALALGLWGLFRPQTRTESVEALA